MSNGRGRRESIAGDGFPPLGEELLLEVVTDLEFTCHVSSGYRGEPGELWYVRVCPSLPTIMEDPVTMTTPYLLLGARKSDWIAYLNKSVRDSRIAPPLRALQELMKFGKKAQSRKPKEAWNE